MPEDSNIYAQLDALNNSIDEVIRRVSFGQSPGQTVDDLLQLLKEVERLKEIA